MLINIIFCLHLQAEEFRELKSSQGQPLIQQYTLNLKPAFKILKIFYEGQEGLNELSGIPYVDAYDHNYKSNAAVFGMEFQQLQAMENVGFFLLIYFFIF